MALMANGCILPFESEKSDKAVLHRMCVINLLFLNVLPMSRENEADFARASLDLEISSSGCNDELSNITYSAF